MVACPLAQIWPWRNRRDPHFPHIALDTLAIGRPKRLGQYYRELARAIEGMRRRDLVDPILDRHFLQWWRDGLILQAQRGSGSTQQVSLGAQR